MPAGIEAVEAVSEILSRVGYNGVAVEQPLDAGDAEHVVKAYVPYDRVARIKVRRVREALGALQAFGLGPIGEARLRSIEDEDWLESWKAGFVPLRVGAFLVLPSWSEADPGELIPLVLDPGMAFGTGTHPTTQQCLGALSTAPLARSRVLDVGTGSGILAVAAAKRGAREVVAVDTDPLAVSAARDAAARNGVAVDVRLGSAADVAGAFEVVVANIVGPVLQRIAPDLRARLATGGMLVAAGIVADAEAPTREAFARAGLREVERDQQGDWIRLTLRPSS